MITPIRTMTINQIVERKNDLLMSSDDIKELARNERNKTIDEFADKCKKDILCQTFGLKPVNIDEIAEQLKGGAT